MDRQFGKKKAGLDEAAIEAFSAAGLAKGIKIRACLTCDGRGDCEECESTEEFDRCYAIHRSRHAGAAGAGAGASAGAGAAAAASAPALPPACRLRTCSLVTICSLD